MSIKSYEKSFASVIDKLISENALKLRWSVKNGNIQPKYISKRTPNKYYFDCLNPNCGHEVLTSPDKIVEGCGCPYCCVPVRNLCGNANCINCLCNTVPTVFGE